MKNKIITVLTICAFAYLVGSFVAASFNLNNWSEFTRIIIATLACAGIIANLSFTYLNSSNNKSTN